ncbi:hypothetical protein Tco_0702325 [Tanacetum coccineum]|uniref:Uncharacterized protein n=1 Tax=Tanacetum coccineum TaxID=301880 RepID=A0ABQ4XVM7_9ASTR
MKKDESQIVDLVCFKFKCIANATGGLLILQISLVVLLVILPNLSSSVPAAETIPTRSGTTTATPSSPVRDAKKGKGIAVEKPTPTQDKTFKQLEEERLGWEVAQRLQAQELADFEKQRAESLFYMLAWDIFCSVFKGNPDLFSPTILRSLKYTLLVGLWLKFENSLLNNFKKSLIRFNSKKLKTGDVAIDVEAPSHSVPQEVEGESLSQDVSCAEVDTPSHSQPIPEVFKLKLHFIRILQCRDVEFLPHIAFYSIPNYTPVHLYAVVDWELLPTGLGSINAIYRLKNSRKYFTSLREILHLVTRTDLMTIYGRVMVFYQDKKAEGVGLVLLGDYFRSVGFTCNVNDGYGLVIHMFVDKKYPLSVNLIERMIDHQLEICHGTVGNEPSLWYVVPTSRVVVPTGRYIVPAGKVIIIVSTGRLSLVPTGRVLSPGANTLFLIVPEICLVYGKAVRMRCDLSKGLSLWLLPLFRESFLNAHNVLKSFENWSDIREEHSGLFKPLSPSVSPSWWLKALWGKSCRCIWRLQVNALSRSSFFCSLMCCQLFILTRSWTKYLFRGQVELALHDVDIEGSCTLNSYIIQLSSHSKT